MTVYLDLRPRGLRLLWRVLGLAAVVASVVAATATASVQPNRYGVISSVNGFWLTTAPQSEWNTQLAAMRANGVQEVRSDSAWGDIQPNAPSSSNPGWQWGHYDAWVSALAKNRLTWQPVVDYNTSWASAVGNNSAFATFAQAVASRYGAHGSFWARNPSLPYEPVQTFEIWNEENVSGANYIPASSYAPLYRAARTAIHQVDPSASVDLGGLADYGPYSQNNDYPAWYIVYLFGADPNLATAIDGFALHPYGPSAGDSAQWVVDFRHTLSHYNVPASIPVDITEVGWQYDSANESWRAGQMNDLGFVLSHSNCGVRLAAPYDWFNQNNPGGDWGLVDGSSNSTSLRPAGTGWFTGLAQGGAQPTYVMC